MTASFQKAVGCDYSDEIKSVLSDSVPVLLQMVLEYGNPDMLSGSCPPGKKPLTTKYVSLPHAIVLRTEDQHLLAALWT